MDAPLETPELPGDVQARSMQRIGRRLRRYNPLLMAWVSGMNVAFVIASVMDDQSWIQNAIMAGIFATLAMFTSVEPPTD